MYFGLKFKGHGHISEHNVDLHMRRKTKDYGTFEEIFIRRIYDVELPITPTTIIDAGGNIGLASLFFKWRYPAASIVSFEVEDENFALLEKNLSTYKDIRTVKKGLYSKNCFLKIYNPTPENDSNSFVVEETSVGGAGTIESVTIDTVMKEQGWDTVDLLKMDIEGAEKEIFEGDVASWLPRVKCMMIEPHDRMKKGCSRAIFEGILPYDFEMITATEGTLIFVNEKLVPLKR